MGFLIFYLIGVAMAAFGMFCVVCKDLDNNPDMRFTVGDLLLVSGLSLLSWFAVGIFIVEGSKYLIERLSVSQSLRDFLNKDLRKSR